MVTQIDYETGSVEVDPLTTLALACHFMLTTNNKHIITMVIYRSKLLLSLFTNYSLVVGKLQLALLSRVPSPYSGGR